MRIALFIALGLAATGTIFADENLPVLKVGIDVYTNVTVTRVTATDIYFTYRGGMGNAKLKQLSPELQQHFGYNSGQATAVEQKQATANTQYRAQAAQAPAARPVTANTAAGEAAGSVSWGTDLPTALNQARSEKKMVLLDFTGSDWCPWCIKFDHEVLSTSRFAAYARTKLVLVKVDFPRRTPQPEALKQANQQLAKRFSVDGYPTYVLLNFGGKELGRQAGYAEGGADAFIAKLDGFSGR